MLHKLETQGMTT